MCIRDRVVDWLFIIEISNVSSLLSFFLLITCLLFLIILNSLSILNFHYSFSMCSILMALLCLVFIFIHLHLLIVIYFLYSIFMDAYFKMFNFSKPFLFQYLNNFILLMSRNSSSFLFMDNSMS